MSFASKSGGYNLSDGTVVVSPTGVVTSSGSVYISEQAEAQADSAGYGQLWVKSESPSELWYTDDAGTDSQLGSADPDIVTATGTLNNNFVVIGDGYGKEVQTTSVYINGAGGISTNYRGITNALDISLVTNVSSGGIEITEDNLARAEPMIFMESQAARVYDIFKIYNRSTATNADSVAITQWGGGHAMHVWLGQSYTNSALRVTEGGDGYNDGRTVPMIDLQADAYRSSPVIEIVNPSSADAIKVVTSDPTDWLSVSASGIATGSGTLGLSPVGDILLQPGSGNVVVDGTKLILDGAYDSNNYLSSSDASVDMTVENVAVMRWSAANGVLCNRHVFPDAGGRDLGKTAAPWNDVYLSGKVTGTRGWMLDLSGDSVVGTSGEHIYSDADGDLSVNYGDSCAFYDDGSVQFVIDQTITAYRNMAIRDNFSLALGNVSDAGIRYSTAQTPNSAMMYTSTQSNAWVFCEKADIGVDFAHPLQDDPTLYMQGADDPTDWLSVSASGIATGSGSLGLNPAGGSVDINGDFNMVAGSKIVFDSDEDSNNYLWSVGDTAVDWYVEGVRLVRAASTSFTVGGHLYPTSNNGSDLGRTGAKWRTGYFGTSVTGDRGWMLDLSGDSVVGTSGEHIYSDVDDSLYIQSGGNTFIRSDSANRAIFGIINYFYATRNYFYSQVILTDATPLVLGSSLDTSLGYQTAQTPDALVLGVGADSNGFIICEEADTTYDFAHPLQTNPTIFMQSANQSATEWGSIAHDQTDFVINQGAGTTKLSGGLKHNITTVNVATYDLLITDNILLVTYTATAAVTSLTLPTAQTEAGRIVVVKDAGGNASTNNITIDTEGAQTIDGAATFIISTDYQDIKLVSDGSNWYLLAQ